MHLRPMTSTWKTWFPGNFLDGISVRNQHSVIFFHGMLCSSCHVDKNMHFKEVLQLRYFSQLVKVWKIVNLISQKEKKAPQAQNVL